MLTRARMAGSQGSSWGWEHPAEAETEAETAARLAPLSSVSLHSRGGEAGASGLGLHQLLSSHRAVRDN